MSEKQILSLAEFHEPHKNRSIYNEQRLIDDATTVYNKLKTPKAIADFYNNYDLDKVPEIKDNHSGGSFLAVCSMAYEYAKYVTGEKREYIFQNKIMTAPIRLLSQEHSHER